MKRLADPADDRGEGLRVWIFDARLPDDQELLTQMIAEDSG